MLHAFCGIFIGLPRIKLEFEGVLITGVLITICKPDGGDFRIAIIKALEKVSYAEDLGVIGNHYSSFAE